MTDVTDVAGVMEAEMIPEGELSPLDKARLPEAMQVAGVLVFVAGLIPTVIVLGTLLCAVCIALFRLVTTGSFALQVNVSWATIGCIIAGVIAMLAGRGILRLQKAWRMLVLIALWVAAAYIFVSFVSAIELFLPELSLTSELIWPLMGWAMALAASMALLALLTCRSTTEAFGGKYSWAHQLVVRVATVVAVVMLLTVVVVLFVHRQLTAADAEA